jgi:hypothetical protein
MKTKKNDYSIIIGLMAIGLLLLATLVMAVSHDGQDDTYQGMMRWHMDHMYDDDMHEMMQDYDFNGMVDEDGDGLCDMCGMPLEDCEEIMGDFGNNGMMEHMMNTHGNCPMVG